MIDWCSVRDDYMEGMSYGQLATKYGCSKSAVAKHGKDGNWGTQRTILVDDGRKVDSHVLVVPPQDAVTEKMLNAVIGLTNIINDAVTDGCSATDAQGYANTIKSLQQTYSNLVGTQYLLDLEKIEALKRQYQVVSEDAETGVIILPEVVSNG